MNMIQLAPKTLLTPESALAAIQRLYGLKDAARRLCAGKDQLDGVRMAVKAAYISTTLVEVPYPVLISAQCWWVEGFNHTVVGG